MHFNQAVAIATLPIRKMTKAFSPKRRKTDAGDDSRAIRPKSQRLSASTMSSSSPEDTGVKIDTSDDSRTTRSQSQRISTPTMSSSSPEDSGVAPCEPITRMLESEFRLRPSASCLKAHGKGKKPMRRDHDPDEPMKTDCGYYTICDEAHMFPKSAKPTAYRLTTKDPVHDLKRWLTTRNQNIMGDDTPHRCEQIHFVEDEDRFSDAVLRECILWAVEEIKYRHGTIQVQIDYLERQPYSWSFFVHPIADATPVHKLPTQGMLAGMDRDDLEFQVEEMAVELDYLEEKACFIRAETFALKWELARDGNWGEIADLLNTGYINEEMVRRACHL